MLEAWHMRYKYAETYTRSILFIEGVTFHILERPWLDNTPNASCIPTGTYVAQFLPRSGSGKFKNVFWLRNVPGRSGILYHGGTLVKHSLGCPLVGMKPAEVLGQPAISNYATAMGLLNEVTQQQDFLVHIVGEPNYA